MFSPKSHSVINIIAWVSLVAVAVPTAAMIILLAMFDGLTESIEELNTAIDADIEIVTQRGQTFHEESIDFESINAVEGVVCLTPYIEQSVMASATGRQYPINIRGVEPTYFDVMALDSYVARGSLDAIASGDIVLGVSLASSLGAYGIGTEIELFALNRKQLSTLLPTSGISKLKTRLGGVISANNQINESVALVSLESAQQLLNYANRISGIAIKIAPDSDPERIADEISAIAGEEYDILTRERKNASINAILRMEKFAIVLIGALIALVATFAIVGSVVMLMTEKRRDIATLRAMGASQQLICNIFVGEGVLLSTAGTLLGALLGVGFTLIQKYWGVVKIPGGSILESYPVSLSGVDVVIVIALVMAMGTLISTLTVRSKLR
ncbi:MAG: ABC transporter permease [Alistipes sp.]|nr:ABC transporter permease [Alistipes sp.]MBO7263931.1 ABC transporter permease [Alistipes sp.]